MKIFKRNNPKSGNAKRGNRGGIIRNARGFSLAETAAALAIVVAVSIATYSLIVSSSNLSAKNLVDRKASMHAASLIECFRYAESESDLTAAFNKVDSDYERSSSELTDRYVYEYEKKGYLIRAVAVYGETYSFTVTAYRGESFVYGEENVIENEIICSYDGLIKGGS